MLIDIGYDKISAIVLLSVILYKILVVYYNYKMQKDSIVTIQYMIEDINPIEIM